MKLLEMAKIGEWTTDERPSFLSLHHNDMKVVGSSEFRVQGSGVVSGSSSGESSIILSNVRFIF